MKRKLKNLFGFRSDTGWKKLVAVVWYALSLAVLLFGLLTSPLVECGFRDALIYKVSVLVIFTWMISPAIFLSKTPLRAKLPLFRANDRTKAIIGMGVVFLIFTYLFAMVESWHTPQYQAAIDLFYDELFRAAELVQ